MKLLTDGFSELPEIRSSAESVQRSLDSQRELFYTQIDHLQRIVVTQCQLTGVNPLAQEMAAGALSVNIGKKPRDLLNPKAVKYMQSVFSVKDAVSKKECREISALFGVTVTQVREFFASQRSRVRKLVFVSREKAVRSNAPLELQEEIPLSSDPFVPIDLVPLNSIEPTKDEERPSCSTEDDLLPVIDDSDKQFVDSIFSLMGKEETFSGQVKLAEWILRMQNSAVLCWFLSKGGSMILATWLSQAAVEEQTSLLLVILNVLCHLPLNKALPVHMSAILQSVNRLRFYKTSDISNRARVLLSNWSKLLTQALKKPNGIKSSIDEEQELILKQSLSDVIADESWQSSIDTPDNILGSSDDIWKPETTQVLRLLPASSDDSNKKNILGVSSSQTRERRKVQLVEQPGQKTAGRSPQATRAVQLNHSRPMSADDIQKAKIRAQLMQSKYSKASASSANKKLKAEILYKPSTSLADTLPPVPKVPILPKLEEHKTLRQLPPKVLNPLEDSFDLKPKESMTEPLWEKGIMVQISWQIPPEVRLNHQWRVGTGENSKEIEIQKNRNRREMETVYQAIKDVPPNPKEPWDIEMDYDDSLTPVIPAEQLPEVEGAEMQLSPNHNSITQAAPSERENGVVGSSRCLNVSTAEPDLELLAVLLKNPELVIALTTGQAANLPPSETVKLLDMIKAGGAGNANVVNRPAEEKVEVSLPSPTPASNPGTSGWRPEAVRNPFLQRRASGNQSVVVSPPVAIQTPVVRFTTPLAVSSLVAQGRRIEVDGPLHQKISLTSSSTVQNNLYTPISNIKPAHVSTTTNSFTNLDERFHVSTTANQSLSPAPAPRLPSHLQHHAAYPKVEKPGTDNWRASRQGPSPNYHNPLLNQNSGYSNNPASLGPTHMSTPAGLQWERNAREGGNFESWSPDNSPTRNREYAMMGRNFPEPRMGYRADQSRVRDSSNSDHNRYGNRKWRDRRR